MSDDEKDLLIEEINKNIEKLLLTDKLSDEEKIKIIEQAFSKIKSAPLREERTW